MRRAGALSGVLRFRATGCSSAGALVGIVRVRAHAGGRAGALRILIRNTASALCLAGSLGGITRFAAGSVIFLPGIENAGIAIAAGPFDPTGADLAGADIDVFRERNE